MKKPVLQSSLSAASVVFVRLVNGCACGAGHVYLIDRKCRVWTCRVVTSALRKFRDSEGGGTDSPKLHAQEQLPLPAGHDLCGTKDVVHLSSNTRDTLNE